MVRGLEQLVQSRDTESAIYGCLGDRVGSSQQLRPVVKLPEAGTVPKMADSRSPIHGPKEWSYVFVRRRTAELKQQKGELSPDLR